MLLVLSVFDEKKGSRIRSVEVELYRLDVKAGIILFWCIGTSLSAVPLGQPMKKTVLVSCTYAAVMCSLYTYHRQRRRGRTTETEHCFKHGTKRSKGQEPFAAVFGWNSNPSPGSLWNRLWRAFRCMVFCIWQRLPSCRDVPSRPRSACGRCCTSVSISWRPGYESRHLRRY